MYAQIIDGTIAVTGVPPDSCRRLDTGDWVLGITAADEQTRQACGWFDVVDTAKPDDTDATTFDQTIELVEGTPTVVWAERAKTDVPPPPPTAEERIADLEAKLAQAEPTPDDIPATANPLSAQVAQLSATVEALTGELDRLKVVDAATIEATAKDATASKELIAKVAEAFGISWDEADKVRLTDAKRWGEWLTKLGIGGDPKADGDIGAVEAVK